MNQQQHIQTIVNKQNDQARSDYRKRLTASIDCIRFLLRQGLAFRGHDETEDSENQGNFLEILKFLCDHNEDIKRVAIDKCPGNLKLTSPDIQKDIVHVCAIETTKIIVQDLKDSFFSILVDEARDVSTKEQMGVVVRYVNNDGQVIERILGIVHVTNTTALSLKVAIEDLFFKHNLSLSQLRGQGYDGASNMQGEYNGLKTLILKENQSAFYIHCFAHQLQLALVAVAKKNVSIEVLFIVVNDIVNVVGGSCKRRDILLENQAIKVFEALETGELLSGRGQNQQSALKRPSETRWSSHYNTLISLVRMFSSVIEVLDLIIENPKSEKRGEASRLLDALQSFDMVFCIILMKNILGITNELSLALQRKDQDIVNAMNLVKIAKNRLQSMREDGWSSLLDEIFLFCVKHDINIINMDDGYIARGRSRRNAENVTNMHHYRVDLFYSIIDLQLQELNNRFNEVSTELLICVSCLSPMDSFSSFDKKRLAQLAQLYPDDFSNVEVLALENELETYIIDVRSSADFNNLLGVNDLAIKLVETRKNTLYPLVYRLISLALILPISTATVERVFSAMKIVKTRLRNRVGDQFLADCLVPYIEKDIFDCIDNETIIHCFQNMKTRRCQL
ncbi:hypothetical protein J5N97_019366 [Dioscorea zingiberensis]|uniref:Zinc finger MYM-type protein 1-like n=1 Tax=Dioscorea zingiberensis TaxID=325984 RepID=A0A9D5CDQ2_9LILI|nr:hypothetical protein J5N97_019366 [Dioscorea zingiberensis]